VRLRQGASGGPADRSAGCPVSVGPNVIALVVYLLAFQQVPVERCRRLVEDVTGAAVSDGFIHFCLAKAAVAAAGVVKLIKTLSTAAYVAGFDETTLRAGAAGKKKHVLGAFTEDPPAFFLGRRTLKPFRDFGVLPGFAGVAVSDRYVNYFHHSWEHLAGQQACCAHLLRDYQDAAGSWPEAIWPGQAQRAQRGLISA
jgi:transposase